MHCVRVCLILFVVAQPRVGTSQDPVHAPKFLGSASCAASACHAAPRAGVRDGSRRRGNEYTLWRQSDPHARALSSLSSDQGERILKALGIEPNRDDRGFVNCLKCHNLEPEPSLQATTWHARDHVSCESCHGPAEKWISVHATDGWGDSSTPSGEESQIELGFVPARQMAKKCAECHVGAKDREVNHDLIAAGHPPLRFEFAMDMARLPKHWRSGTQTRSQQWLSGQQANALAFLELVESRLGGDAVIPEFSEYDCRSCHHPISARPRLIASGEPRWGDWYFTTLPVGEKTGKTVDDLRSVMQDIYGEKTRSRSGLVRDVQSLRQNITSSPPQPTFDLPFDLERQSKHAQLSSWDAAAQAYLFFANGMDDTDVRSDAISLLRDYRSGLKNDLGSEFTAVDSGASRIATLHQLIQLYKPPKASKPAETGVPK